MRIRSLNIQIISHRPGQIVREFHFQGHQLRRQLPPLRFQNPPPRIQFRRLGIQSLGSLGQRLSPHLPLLTHRQSRLPSRLPLLASSIPLLILRHPELIARLLPFLARHQFSLLASKPERVLMKGMVVAEQG